MERKGSESEDRNVRKKAARKKEDREVKKGPVMDERAEESRASWWAASIPAGDLLFLSFCLVTLVSCHVSRSI